MGLCLCEQFGESLDRITLWDRIASAYATAIVKCDDGDTDRLMSMALEHVRADPSRAATDGRVASCMGHLAAQSIAWRQGFVRYLATRSFAVLSHTKVAWEKQKAENKDARALRTGGELSTGEIVTKGGAL